MSNLLKCQVSFRIYGDNLDPSEITNMLYIEPSISHKKNDPNTRVSKKGKLIQFSPYSSGLWSVSSKESQNAILEDHIKSLLILLEPVKDKLTELLNRGYKMDLFCGVFTHDCSQPGFNIDASILRRIGGLNISLGICFY